MAQLGEMLQPGAMPGVAKPPATEAEYNDLKQRWLDTLTAPQTRAALLQFGVSMLQPVNYGQSEAGNVGLAVGDAAQAGARVTAAQQADADRANAFRQQQVENRQTETELGQREATIAEAARHNVAAERLDQATIDQAAATAAETQRYRMGALSLDQQQFEEAVRAAGVSEKQTQQQIDLQKEQVLQDAIKLQLDALKVPAPPGYEAAVKALAENWDPTDPVSTNAFLTGKANLDKAFGLSAAAPATAAPGPTATPAPSASGIDLSRATRTATGQDGTKIYEIDGVWVRADGTKVQ